MYLVVGVVAVIYVRGDTVRARELDEEVSPIACCAPNKGRRVYCRVGHFEKRISSRRGEKVRPLRNVNPLVLQQPEWIGLDEMIDEMAGFDAGNR